MYSSSELTIHPLFECLLLTTFDIRIEFEFELCRVTVKWLHTKHAYNVGTKLETINPFKRLSINSEMNGEHVTFVYCLSYGGAKSR